MITRYCSLLLIALLWATAPANAARPNYNYVGASYVNGEADADDDIIDSDDIDQEGFRIDTSAQLLNDNLWLFASYAKTDDDDNVTINAPGVFTGIANVDLEIETIQAGVGVIIQPEGMENTTVDFSARYRKDDFDVDVSIPGIGSGSGGDDANGLGFSGGIRSNITDMFEVYARLGVLTSDYGNTPNYELGALLNIGDWFALTAAYEYVDIDDFDIELTNYRLGARVKF